MRTDLLDRLDAIIEVADLEHQVECLYSGSGNRKYEATLGVLEALRSARDTLAQPNDPTSAIVVGNIIQNIGHLKLFGCLPLPSIKGLKWLHIGDISKLENGGKQEHGMRIEYKIVDTIEGTRAQVLRTFLKRNKNPQ